MSMPAEHLTHLPTLDQLLDGIAEAPALDVEGIACDSRRVGPGYVFLAVAGLTHHGIDFWSRAVEAGCIAMVYDSTTAPALPDEPGVPMIAAPGLGEQLGEIANRFYDRPSESLGVIGVTGTNGKSTVAWMLAAALSHLGARAGYNGTLGYGVDDIVNDDEMTSPDVIELHRRLADFRDAGATYAAIEVSSHALDQRRVDGVRFDATLFTNLSRDHLDYHGSMRDYGEAKAKLFTEHRARRRVINLDSEFGTELASRCRGDVITVSTKFDRVANGRPYVFVRSVVARERGSEICVQSSYGDICFELAMPGEFNVANAVLVLGYLCASGIELGDAASALAAISAPPGRMQRVNAPGPGVYVDYAHTPGALEVVLRALRSHCRGKLWCVFGCGGDRDAGKRPLMGRIAERLADQLVITNDNPRSEDPAAIVEAIVAGMKKPDRATVIEDRGAAIAWAIAYANDKDVVLVAGKGHENYQLIDGVRLDFSDYGAALANLEARDSRGDA
ncbi:MAG: UDP-N-acetylmuramoyl-L-alanyl-D-glutamate--2,6-diaminopimelate ligase [Woeseiaceae bacterium]|nr:UDP-N-acetylmuramoyl-L-alanyl-D-glutamate--2,6-diaminopimelate ligase [Woeseiaceae bacterium]